MRIYRQIGRIYAVLLRILESCASPARADNEAKPAKPSEQEKFKNLKKMKKKVFLAIFCLQFIGVSVWAQTIIDEGTTGECVWKVTSDSVLTISGSGAMADYDYTGNAPWSSLYVKIKTIIIEDDVTVVGKNAFSTFNVTSIKIGNSVTTIKDEAFWGGDFSITFGSSIATIGYSFVRTYMTEITSLAKNPPIINDRFSFVFYNGMVSNGKDIPIYVPKCAEDDYRIADGWSEFTNIIGVEMDVCEETTNIVDAKCELDEVVGYFSITGQKLTQEPEKGLYIVLYSNGKTVKMMK